jgi:opacity protein-like surface antigen
MSQTHITPYSPSFQNQPGYTPSFQGQGQGQSVPGSPGGASLAYAGMPPMSSASSQQPYQVPPQDPQQQQAWGGQQFAPWSSQQQQQQQQQQAYDRPVSGHSNLAPLPMWVERARTSNNDDVASMGNTNSSYQGYAEQQPNAFYGAHYSGNAGAQRQ